MLYYLFEYLQETNFPGASLFSYVSFRAMTAAFIALIVSIWFGKHFINRMHKKKVFENQNRNVPGEKIADGKLIPVPYTLDEKDEFIKNLSEKERKLHITQLIATKTKDQNGNVNNIPYDLYNTEKKDVPTFGGLIILVATIVSCLLIGKLHNIYTLLLLATTIILGALGFADDYIKTFKGKKDGIKPITKIVVQLIVGIIVAATLRIHPAVVINETVNVKIEDNKEVVVKSPDIKSTRTTMPFVKDWNINYANLFKWAGEKWMYTLGWGLLILITLFAVLAVSNGSNLNDGMDGMAAGNTAVMAVTLGIIAYISSNAVMAGHLNQIFVPNSEEVVVFLSGFVGALLGYLWYNAYPAQIFMGDTGSLTIGGIIAVSAIIIHKELMLILLCGVFLFEILADFDSKIFIKTGKKHRIWKYAPLHDHFRKPYRYFKERWGNATVSFKGNGRLQHEVKITTRFWIVSIILAAITLLLTLKIR